MAIFKREVSIGETVLIPAGSYPLIFKVRNHPLQNYMILNPDEICLVLNAVSVGTIVENFSTYDMPDCVAVSMIIGKEEYLIEVHCDWLLQVVK